MAWKHLLPSFAQSLRLVRLILSITIAIIIGTALRSSDTWTPPIKRSVGFMMFCAITTLLHDCLALLLALDRKAADCTYPRKRKTWHGIVEGLLSVLWWSAVASAATAVDNMLLFTETQTQVQNQLVPTPTPQVVGRYYVPNEELWKRQDAPAPTTQQTVWWTPETTWGPAPTTPPATETQKEEDKKEDEPVETRTPEQILKDQIEEAVGSRAGVVAGVGCAGLVGALSTGIWVVISLRATR